ncbi:HAMP domain-containing sensor histidine kinase [Polynucleobacter sp. MWH-UH23A]|uniref:sensor histidine kinase n=1 Tax=Polynucleobacter sp. MWH-UH23A TaxID=1855613 RepID=UPI003364C233
MNTFVLVLVIPAMLTIVSASTLYFSFKGRVDTSGRYFLLSEFLWLLALLIVIVLNVLPNLISHPSFFVLSVVTLLSEIAILLSIKALTKKIQIREFIYWIIFVTAYCGFIEYFRGAFGPRFPLLFFSSFSICVTSITYIACKRTNSNGLESNLFIKWILYAELGLTVVHVLRFSSFFTGAPMTPFNPVPLAIIFFSIWFSINLVRYFSYLALRVSWVDPRTSNDNPLNQNLVKLTNEKEQFLQGLISSNRALGISALANSLAHQLSQPITGILLQTESVKRDLIDQGDQEKSVQILNTVTEQLGKVSGLVTNLRKLFGAKEPEFKRFNIQGACNEVLEIIKPTLQSKNITLKVSYTGSPIIVGNPIQIQQVLINIFNNAIDAIENAKTQRQEIDLSIFQTESSAVIAIKDTGSGISDNIASNMFELYQSTKPEGLGIGLWLCKTIIDKHHGSITALNLPTGGAIFEIHLPLAEELQEDN